jgi:hypothetical protein
MTTKGMAVAQSIAEAAAIAAAQRVELAEKEHVQSAQAVPGISSGGSGEATGVATVAGGGVARKAGTAIDMPMGISGAGGHPDVHHELPWPSCLSGYLPRLQLPMAY